MAWTYNREGKIVEVPQPINGKGETVPVPDTQCGGLHDSVGFCHSKEWRVEDGYQIQWGVTFEAVKKLALKRAEEDFAEEKYLISVKRAKTWDELANAVLSSFIFDTVEGGEEEYRGWSAFYFKNKVGRVLTSN